MPEGSRPESIYKLGDPAALRTINKLLFGHPGVGKTPFWGTAEGGLIMDSDGGIESAEAFGSSCDVAPARDFKEIVDLYEFFRYGPGCKEYRWAIWDGLTLFMDRALNDEVLPDAIAKRPREGNAEFVADRGEYLVVQNRLGSMVRKFVDLPINFGASAHVMTAEDPEGNSIYVPFIPGQKGEFSSKIAGYFNIVAYMGISEGGTRRILTERSGYYFSRDRFHAVRTRMKSGELRGYLNNPTVPKVEQLVSDARRRRDGKDQGEGRQRRRRVGTRR
jgi:AAA domain